MQIPVYLGGLRMTTHHSRDRRRSRLLQPRAAGGAGLHAHSPLTTHGIAGGAGSYNHEPPAEPASTPTHHSPLTTHHSLIRLGEHAPDVGEVAGNGGSGGHGGAHQVSTPARALAALEVAVGGTG